MPRLPRDGENDWGSILENFLKQSLDHTGRLVSGPVNPHTGGINSNLASGVRAGLVRLAGDLSNSAANPTVTGLQGNSVSSAAPKHGQVLAWNAETETWEPTDPAPVGLTEEQAHARAMALNSMRII